MFKQFYSGGYAISLFCLSFSLTVTAGALQESSSEHDAGSLAMVEKKLDIDLSKLDKDIKSDADRNTLRADRTLVNADKVALKAGRKAERAKLLSGK